MGQGRTKGHQGKGRRPNSGTAEFSQVPQSLWRAKVVPTNDLEICSPAEGVGVERGDMVLITTRYGRDLARILGPLQNSEDIENDQIRMIHRVADDMDLDKRASLEVKEEEAYQIGRQKIDQRGLEMKLVSAHYLLDEPKVMFFFTAESRIDFRELVKDLVNIFKMRIELRQIGVRDESRVIGGMAVCGRPYCCHGLTDQLSPVSIKMAKDQNLSLNSLKISGPCGRLLCCLAFEHDHYVEEKRGLPNEGCRISIDGTSFKVAEVNIFTKRIQLHGNDGRWLDFPVDRFARKPNGQGWELLPENEHEESPQDG